MLNERTQKKKSVSIRKFCVWEREVIKGGDMQNSVCQSEKLCVAKLAH